VARPHGENGDEKAYPPELGTDSIAILEGRTFMCSNSLGDVPPGSIGGLLHDDTRFISGWELLLQGKPLSLLKSAVVDYYSASFFLTNPDLPKCGLRANSTAVRRLRFVGNGFSEEISARNSSAQTVHIELRLRCGVDYADLFEVKSAVRDRSAQITREHEASGLRFRYAAPGFCVQTQVEIQRADVVDPVIRRVPGSDSDAVIGLRVRICRARLSQSVAAERCGPGDAALATAHAAV
jgi:hypothetical protein